MPDQSNRDLATRLTGRLATGDTAAAEDLFPLLYDELHRVASGFMRRERRDHTLQPTALVHEAYLRMVDADGHSWRGRAQFLGLAAKVMRRILIHHARNRDAMKRGGDVDRVTLGDPSSQENPLMVDLLDLDEALDKLECADARLARIVELRYFGGLTVKEAAEVLEVSVPTVERGWTLAKAWIGTLLGGCESK